MHFCFVFKVGSGEPSQHKVTLLIAKQQGTKENVFSGVSSLCL